MNERNLIRTTVVSQTAVILIAVGTAVHALIIGQWLWLACSIVVVIAGRMNVAFSIAAAILSGSVGAWPAFVAAVLAIGVETFMHMWMRFGIAVDPLDEQALANAVRGLPASLTLRLPVDSPTVVDSAVVLRAAISDDPSRWPPGLRSAPGNSEGGLVGGTRWTVVAAEAALVSVEHPDTTEVIDIHTLAGIAVYLPHSLAGVMIPPENRKQVLTLLGLGVIELGRMTSRACRKPGGELMLHRIELTTKGDPVSDHLLDDAEWHRLARRSTTEQA